MPQFPSLGTVGAIVEEQNFNFISLSATSGTTTPPPVPATAYADPTSNPYLSPDSQYYIQ